MEPGLKWILADVQSLTWVIGLFVMANLADLPNVEIGCIAKLEKSIHLDILRIFQAGGGISLIHTV